MDRTLLAMAVLFLALGYNSRAHGEDQAEIVELIKQLDAEEFTAREAASLRLIEIGPPALPLLKAATASDQNAETRLRAADALVAIDRKLILERPAELEEIIRTAIPAEGDLNVERLDALLDRVATVIRDNTELDFKLPVAVARLPRQPMVVGSQRGVLATLDFGRIITARDCVIVARSAVDISTAQNCIVIARDFVNVRSVKNSLIICGGDIHATRTDGGVLLAGNAIETAGAANQSVLGAGRRVQSVGDVDIFLKTVPTALNPATDAPQQPVPCDDLILDFPAPGLPLANLLKPTTITTLDGGFVLFRLRDGEGEFVARTGKDLTFPGSGEAIPGLEGWQLTYCSTGFAVFTRGAESTVVFVAKR